MFIVDRQSIDVQRGGYIDREMAVKRFYLPVFEM